MSDRVLNEVARRRGLTVIVTGDYAVVMLGSVRIAGYRRAGNGWRKIS